MFEWDEAKRLIVLQARGLDFRDAEELYDGRAMLHIASPRKAKLRFRSIAEKNGKFYTIVWTWREGNQRIITFRRARDAETRAYRQVHG